MYIMSEDYLRVKREPLVSCLTCPLCKNLFMEPTTICVCLHTFCKHCISRKFKEDVSNICPVCKAYLGSFPEELIRPDHTLRDLVMYIFPLGNPTITEEISEALAVDGHTAQENTREIKPNAMSQNVVPQETPVRHHDEGIPAEDNYSINLNQIPQESSSDSAIAFERKVLPQVALTTPDAITHVNSVAETHRNPNQTQLACHEYDENKKIIIHKPSPTIPALNEIDKRIKKKRSMRRRSLVPWSGRIWSGRSSDGMTELSKIMPNWNSDWVERLNSGKQYDPASSAGDIYDEMSNAVWFCLLACEDKTGNALPQIPKPYIRTESGDRAVAHVNKYLARKLNLKHESEVEIMCYGEPLIPNLTLNDVQRIWVQATSDYDTPSVFFESADENADGKKFVMELTYRRNEHKQQ